MLDLTKALSLASDKYRVEVTMALDVEYYKQKNHEFLNRVGAIDWYEDLEVLGVTPRTMDGLFFRRDSALIRGFCRKNSGFHIVSHVSNFLTVNRFDEKARFYLLASGDDDPSIELVFSREIIEHLEREILLFHERLKS